MAHDALVQELLGATKAYAQQYGMPESVEQLQGLVSALLRLKAEAPEQLLAPTLEAVAPALTNWLSLPAQEAEALLRQVVRAVEQGTLTDWVIDTAQQALAQQAYQGQQALESQVKETLSAYVQQVIPGKPLDDLPGLVESIVPLIHGGTITRAEVVALVQRLTASFGLEAALGRRVKPEYLKVAQELALCMAQKPMEEAVKETLAAYLEKHHSAMETVSESLIENAIAAITQLPIEFDWATELSLKDKRLLIKQVSFKLNILQAGPMPSKTAREIVDQVQSEVERFRQAQQTSLASGDTPQGLTQESGLEISSGWTLPIQPPNPVPTAE